jgi:DNA-binding response OmpR family regulator
MDILVIEDDRLIAETIRQGWPVPGDNLRFVFTCAQALPLVYTAEVDFFDGIVLDIHLPDGDGLSILREIRSRTNVPIILISGTGSAESRADAIDLGADDYVMKPFSVRELQARIARHVKGRSATYETGCRPNLAIGTIDCRLQERHLQFDDAVVPLTDAEARIIEQLHHNRNRSCSKSALYKHALFREFRHDDKTLDVYISRIRKKLGGLDEASASLLQTVRGLGYRLNE